MVADNWDNDSGRILGTGLEADPGLGLACTVHTDSQGEEDKPVHRQGLMGVDNQAEHWVWVLHTQGGFLEVVGMSHMAEDKAALPGTGQGEGNLLVNLVGIDLGDRVGGTPGLQ